MVEHVEDGEQLLLRVEPRQRASARFERYRVLSHAELAIEPTSRLTQPVSGLTVR
jgi:hypothetical protein